VYTEKTEMFQNNFIFLKYKTILKHQQK